MPTDRAVMGIFADEGAAVAAVEALAATDWLVTSVHGPVPSHRIARAMNVKKSMVGWFTLAGGIIGFFTGFLLAAFTASQWNLIVSGKPVVALVPFFIVGFEFTILFAVFGNVVGLIHQMQLPGFKGLNRYDERCSGEHFGVVASCSKESRTALIQLFEDCGGETKIFAEREDE